MYLNSEWRIEMFDKDKRGGRTRRDYLKVLGLGAATGLAGCSSSSDEQPTTTDGTTAVDTETETGTDSGTPSVGGTYIYGDTTDAQTMYHPENEDNNTDFRISLVLDGAYTITPDREIFGLWIQDLENTGDSQVFVASLRDNLQWGGDYGQMTAEDWVYHIEEVHQSDWAGSAQGTSWADINVEQTGELEFQIELPSPNTDWPFEPVLWGAYCLPKGLTEQYASDQDLEGLQQDEEIQTLAYAGNLGPYSFEEWNRESEFRAVRNDEYYMREADDVPEEWNDAPYFEEYTYRVIEEESTRLQALRQGEVTQTGIPLDRVSDFEGESGLDVYSIPQPYMSMLVYNQRANGWEPLRVREVRQALSTAVDKDVIVNQILRGNADFSFTFQPRWSDWYDESQITEFGYEDSFGLDQAEQMLRDNLPSDWGYNDDGQIVGPDGEQAELTYVYSEGSENTATIAEYIGNQLEELGLSVSFEVLQFNRMQQQYIMTSVPDDEDPEWSAGVINAGPRDVATSAEPWDLMSGIGFNTYPFAPTGTEAFWHEQAGTNYYGYVPEVDMESKFKNLREESDTETRSEIFAEILGILSEDQPVNFLQMSDDVYGFQDNVEGPVEEYAGDYNEYATYRFTDQ